MVDAMPAIKPVTRSPAAARAPDRACGSTPGWGLPAADRDAIARVRA